MIRRILLTLFVFAGSSLVSFAENPDASQKLHALFEREWEWAMKTYPTWASSLGDFRYNTKWTDEIKDAFLKWLDENEDELPMSREELDEYMKNRTW